MKNFTFLPVCLLISTGNLVVAQQGTLSANFGDSGKVIIKKTNYCQGVAIQADDKILLAGYSGLVRLKKNGAIDSSFSNNGMVNPANFYGKSVAIQSDQKILLGGFTEIEGYYDFTVGRYKTDGRPDKTFGNDGLAITDLAGTVEVGNSVAIQQDGKIVLAGGTNSTDPDGDLCIVRYKPNGSIDSSFGKNGKIINDLHGRYDELTSVAIQADGKIVAAGCTLDGQAHGDFIVVRYLPNGNIDKSFGTNGLVQTNFGADDRGYSLAIQADGKTVVAGSSDERFALIRYRPNGKADSSFGNNGKVITDPGGIAFIHGVAIQADGKIVTAGGLNSNFAVARYKPNGKLDSTFGTQGIVITDFGGTDFAFPVAIQANGKIVVAGISNGKFAVARYNSKNPLNEVDQNNNVADFQALKNDDLNICVFPNPVRDVLNISGLTSSVAKTITVFNANSMLMQQFVTTNINYSFSTARLKAGIYFIQITEGDKTKLLRFVKE